MNYSLPPMQISSSPPPVNSSIESSMRNLTPRVRQYARDIAFWHDVCERDIFSRTRLEPIATARADVMRRLRRDGFSYSQIGRWMKRDHSTVVYHLRAGK